MMPTPIKPESVLLLEKGVLYDQQRDRVAATPKAERTVIPKCPKHLSHEERKEWKTFASTLDNYGLLNIANAKHLEMIAVYAAAWRKCLGAIHESGLIVGKKMNPLLFSLDKISDQIRKCSDKLGLSSTGLAQLGSLVVKAKKKNEMEELMD